MARRVGSPEERDLARYSEPRVGSGWRTECQCRFCQSCFCPCSWHGGLGLSEVARLTKMSRASAGDAGAVGQLSGWCVGECCITVFNL
ncbi:MAG: hypothetical protein ACKOFW_11330 [Planctomycetaceae bacterium]